MSPLAISLIVFACVFGAAVLGTFCVLPQSHQRADSKDTVMLGMGLVATMSALVLGLLVSSAKSFYDAQNSSVTEMSAKVILLDRLMAHDGPEAKPARDALRRAVAGNLDRIWPRERKRTAEATAPTSEADSLFEKIQALPATDDKQRGVKAQALRMAIDIGQTHWLMYEQAAATSFSRPMLAILVFWLVALFFSFGLFSARNVTVTSAMFISALSVAAAIFLILEMYRPYGGIIEVSSAPIRSALEHLGQ
jgi:hypothetical protein